MRARHMVGYIRSSTQEGGQVIQTVPGILPTRHRAQCMGIATDFCPLTRGQIKLKPQPRPYLHELRTYLVVPLGAVSAPCARRTLLLRWVSLESVGFYPGGGGDRTGPYADSLPLSRRAGGGLRRGGGGVP